MVWLAMVCGSNDWCCVSGDKSGRSDWLCGSGNCSRQRQKMCVVRVVSFTMMTRLYCCYAVVTFLLLLWSFCFRSVWLVFACWWSGSAFRPRNPNKRRGRGE